MKNFYELFFHTIRHSSKADLESFRRYINNNITSEIKLRGKRGDDVKQKLNESNSVLPIPSGKKKYTQRIKYIEFVLNQKWEYLYSGGSYDDSKDYYVYAHVDPLSKDYNLKDRLNIVGLPFYIGKGKGNRAWDLNRNQGHDVRIKSVLSKGYGPSHIVNIVRKGLSEVEALALESQLVYVFRTVYENQQHGLLYNIDTGKRPDFEAISEVPDRKQCIIRRGQQS